MLTLLPVVAFQNKTTVSVCRCQRRSQLHANLKPGFYFEIGVIPPCFVDPWRRNQQPETGGGFSRVNDRLQTGTVRRDEAPFSRVRAAVGGRLLRLPAAAERSERTVEADAAGRAVPELHACGES